MWVKPSFDDDGDAFSSGSSCATAGGPHQSSRAAAGGRRQSSRAAAGGRRGQQRRRAPCGDDPAISVAASTPVAAGGLWVSRHTPRSRTELAVQTARVNEVSDWLQDTRRNLTLTGDRRKSGILLLTGPAGCGKSACVRYLAAERKLHLLEWINPSSATYRPAGDNTDLGSFDSKWTSGGDSVSAESQTRQFGDFLRRARRYQTVVMPDMQDRDHVGEQAGPPGGSGRLVLIEELPNALVANKDDLYQMFSDHSRGASCPCVIIMGESGASKSDFSVHNLFPDHVRRDLGIHQITFRPLTTKQLIGALERIAKAEARRCSDVEVPSRDVLEKLAAAADGDIRTAVNSLQFYSAAGGECRDKRPPRKRARPAVPGDQTVGHVEMGGRDASLGLFRTIGKILYAKRCEDTGLLLEQSPESVCDRAAVQSDTIISHLHHNLPHFCPQLENISAAVDYLSHADVLSSADWQGGSVMKDRAVSVACRGVMFCRQGPVRLGFRQFTQPQLTGVTQRIAQRMSEVRSVLCDWRMPCGQLTAELLPFLDLLQRVRIGHGAVQALFSCRAVAEYRTQYRPALEQWDPSDDQDADAYEIEEFED